MTIALEPVTSVDLFENPFVKSKVRHIDIRLQPEPDIFCKLGCKATIWFGSGATRGTHEIDAATLGELISKVQLFLENLTAERGDDRG